MEQVSTNRYRVQPLEVVRLQFSGNGVPSAFVTLSVDGFAPVPPPPPGAFQFTATRPTGQTHFVVVQYAFPPGTPPSASYDTSVSGSFGGTFTGPHVTPAGLLTQNLEFEVA